MKALFSMSALLNSAILRLALNYEKKLRGRRKLLPHSVISLNDLSTKQNILNLIFYTCLDRRNVAHFSMFNLKLY